MGEQREVLSMDMADDKAAKLTLRLVADSGYEAECEHSVSATQWAELLAVCEDGKARRLSVAAPDMLRALELVDTIEAVADEIGGFEHSARMASLRYVVKVQRAAIAKAEGR